MSTSGSLIHYLCQCIIWGCYMCIIAIGSPCACIGCKMVEGNARALAAETELKKYGLFADEYVSTLNGLCDFSLKGRDGPTLGEWCNWDCDQTIIIPNCSSYELGTNLANLCGVGGDNGRVAIDNRILSKGLTLEYLSSSLI